jgi:L-ascorbate metabolism protein UlaG (beta-lactamase superfamily)
MHDLLVSHTRAIGTMFRRILISSMDLTWLGHACFRLRGREGVVLTDPPDPHSGAAIPKTAADLVTISN